ncbi:melanocortin receptor 5-like [Clytia hemisphaerica]|uniref:melanocortin receptor 5-like n=1 Tax=Clytia hemisphaerica TaxID=252671 RepID=UPI0034D4A8F6
MTEMMASKNNTTQTQLDIQVQTTIKQCLFEELDFNERSKTNFRILAIFALFTITATILLNGLVVIAMVTSKQYRKLPSHALLLVLAVCDLLIGVISLPPYDVHMWLVSNGNLNCQLSKFVKLSGYSMSSLTVLTIAVISVELYLAIVRPFLYEHVYNRKYYLVLLVSVWCLFLASHMVFLYIFPEDWRLFKRYIAPVILISVFMVIIMFHSLIYSELKRLKRQTTTNPTFRSGQRAHKKAFLMTTSIIVVFAMCYLPIAIVMLYEHIKTTSTKIETFVLPWCEFIALSNPILDPMIYCFRLRFIRRRIKQLLCSTKIQHSGSIHARNGDLWTSNGSQRYVARDVRELFRRRSQPLTK